MSTLAALSRLEARPGAATRRAAAAAPDRIGWLAAPAVGALALVYALPLLWLLSRSVAGPEGLSLARFAAFFADPYSWRVLGNTLRVAGFVTLLCLVIGYPVAVAMARARGAMQAVLLVAIILPLSVGVVVKAFAWQIVLRRDGVVAQALVGSGLVDETPRLLFTETGLVVGAANVFLPFMILPIYSLLRLIDPRLGEAGATLGASPFYRFRRILLPLIAPALLAGWVYIFVVSFRELSSSILLYTPGNEVLSISIFELYANARFGELSALGVIMVLILAVLVGVAYKIGARVGLKSE